MNATLASPRGGLPAGVGVIDADVHAHVPSIDALAPWLDSHWREVAVTTQFRGPTDTAYPPSAPTQPAPRPRGRPWRRGTVDDLRARVLDPWDVEAAILHCSYGTEAIKNPDAAVALAGAVNGWLVAEWLEPEPRLRGLDRRAGAGPAGRRRRGRPGGRAPGLRAGRGAGALVRSVRAPDLVAAARGRDAPRPGARAALRRARRGTRRPRSGWPTTYLEEYVDMASAFQAQLMSLVAEGAFDRFPTLRVICVESGFAWLPSLLWRFDRLWRGLRREIPWTRRLPSGYLREHVRLTTQPFDAPADAAGFGRVLDQIGSDEMLCFATDYPHWQADTDAAAIPPLDDEAALAAIMSGNARRLYRLGGAR